MDRFNVSIAAARTNAKMTQREFAVELGVSLATVNNWESGKTEPTVSQLRRISEISGIPMDFIFVPCKS